MAFMTSRRRSEAPVVGRYERRCRALGDESPTIDEPGRKYAMLFDAERLQLSVQRRALHSDEFGRSRYVAAKAADLGHEIITLERFAGLAKRKAQQFLAPDPARYGWHKRANLRRKHSS